ncbi:site-specific integrase [uncultured Gimesia sp.]|uniref:tyrosine-type recombinase/integrase n=1 Tax=uncultured Gimesia sp. TaxID=1678688 RepID=UPI0030DCC62B|tara:strand:+ start:16884 stop:18167 length:1284 start_codon:yes stop_codon:yes gene_type:complete
MASIHQKPTGIYYVTFRFPINEKPKQFNRSLKTQSKKIASARCVEIEETIVLIETGRISISDGMTEKEIGNFILSGGKLTAKPTAIKSIKLETLWNEYAEKYAVGKEPSSIDTEKTHMNNLVLFMGNIAIQSITTDKLQKYVKDRMNPPTNFKNKPVAPRTIGKEIQTFNFLWGVAQRIGYISKEKESPAKDVILPKGKAKKPFAAWEQIDEIVKHLTDEKEIKEEWDCLFLRESELEELLKFVKENARHNFIHPAFCFAIYTGARRSEIMRSEISDFDFKNKRVQIRQKKKDRTQSLSYRQIRIHPKLTEVMKDYFKNNHVGGKFTIATLPDPKLSKARIVAVKPKPLSKDQMRQAFERTLKNSKWEVLKGWHVFRHSFCSNLAQRGKPEAAIASCMGHKPNSEVTEQYRHLFPEDMNDAMDDLFT